MTHQAHTRGYESVPLPGSPHGRRLYERGRELVREGLCLRELVWDADEVLWDWVMQMPDVVRGLPRAVLRADLGHREHVSTRPGILELLWGLRHESLARGEDGVVRIWTNGYPWRIWRIAQEVPGLRWLLGAPDPWPEGEGLSNVFTRLEYVQALVRLLEDRSEEALDGWSSAARRVMCEHLRERPLDTTLKLPELAWSLGRASYLESTVLIDNDRLNVARFVASGRRGVWVESRSPRILFGRIPNTVWTRAERPGFPHASAEEVAQGLASVHRGRSGHYSARARPGRGDEGTSVDFAIDIPDRVLREEWILPLRRLRKLLRARGRESRGVWSMLR